MAATLTLFGLGLGAAFLGAELFVRAASSIAVRVGIPPVVIGLTIVAWGTSSPELAVSLRAALEGQSGVALGNVVGSNIFNVGIILGLAACIRPLTVQLSLLRIDAPILVALTLVFCALFAIEPLSRTDGLLLLAGFVLYSFLTLVSVRRKVPAAVVQEFTQEQPPPIRSPWLVGISLVGGLAMLIYGGALLVEQAVILSRASGISERVIGLTIVAAGTSCPELLTSLVAAYHRSADIAVGNIIGSNIFNLAAILGSASVISPIDSGGLAALDLAALVGSSLVLLPLMQTDFRITRWEGALLLAAYGGYLTLLLR